MKSDPAREHHEKMRAIVNEWERKVSFQAQRAYMDVSDVYWLAHDFLGAVLAAEGHRTEEELGHALKTFKHDFLSIAPDLADKWQAFFDDLSQSQYGGVKPDPEYVHQLFVRCEGLITETMQVAIEPLDEFTHHIQAVKILVQNGEVEKAEERYHALVSEYDKLSDDRKQLHYNRFNELYQSILAARNAQRA